MKLSTVLLTCLAAFRNVAADKVMTQSEAYALSNDLLAAMTETMATNSMKAMAKKYFAPSIAWDWSGPQTGTGTPDDVFARIAAELPGGAD